MRDMGMGMIGMMVGMGMIGDGTKVREDRWRWESPCAAFLVSYSMLQTSDTATYNACIIIAAGKYQLLSSREKRSKRGI